MELAHRPYGLLAELTYRCPLHCPYCSNPAKGEKQSELDTLEWKKTLSDAAELGVLQVGFSGGEPLQRRDLEQLIQAARAAGLYTNLITSGVNLTEERAARLLQSGLDNVQVSFQAAEPGLADGIAGLPNAHQRKLRAAEFVNRVGLTLSLNVVLHRFNIDSLAEIIALAENLGATRLELANTQYYGWAYRNRSILIPTRAQVEKAGPIAFEARQRLAGRMKVLYVAPDYFVARPKPCMNGWGQRYLTVNPSGFVLPCPTAWEIPGLRFETLRERPLSWIWTKSESFNRFRGTEWMPEPCRSCPQKEIDFGGCRCQAALLTGDPTNTDPACEFSPHHGVVRESADRQTVELAMDSFSYRQNP
jgi:pyrroloquinoline quinone biosynthesis protein E